MRFEVPQFIEVEDKIFGPFTWKQFVYLAGGGGILFTLYLFLPFVLFLVFAVPIGVFVAALAFYPVNSRPFSVFLESVVTYFSKTKLYLWKKQDKEPAAQSAQKESMLYTPPTNNTIATLSRKLELNAMEKK